MKTIPFPNNDVPAIRKGKKNTTLRISNELGKYSVGDELQVTTYAGDPLGITIKVTEVTSTVVASLPGFGIPARGIRQLKNSGVDVFDQTRVDIIRFELLTI